MIVNMALGLRAVEPRADFNGNGFIEASDLQLTINRILNLF